MCSRFEWRAARSAQSVERSARSAVPKHAQRPADLGAGELRALIELADSEGRAQWSRRSHDAEDARGVDAADEAENERDAARRGAALRGTVARARPLCVSIAHVALLACAGACQGPQNV